jgi:hypothetical protein
VTVEQYVRREPCFIPFADERQAELQDVYASHTTELASDRARLSCATPQTCIQGILYEADASSLHAPCRMHKESLQRVADTNNLTLAVLEPM